MRITAAILLFLTLVGGALVWAGGRPILGVLFIAAGVISAGAFAIYEREMSKRPKADGGKGEP